MGLKSFILGFVPASRWEIWSVQAESQHLQDRMLKAEARLARMEMENKKELRLAEKEAQIEDKRERMLEFLPRIMDEWKIPQEARPMIMTMINQNQKEIDEFLSANLPMKCSFEQALTIANTLKPLLMAKIEGGQGGQQTTLPGGTTFY